jgi:hypothetical protein
MLSSRITSRDCRMRLANWPAVDDVCQRWLGYLTKRERRCVELAYGQRYTVCDTAAYLGISERTVYYDLARARALLSALYDECFFTSDGARMLACMVVRQAWCDATRGNGRIAQDAREWLGGEMCELILDLLGIDCENITGHLRETLEARLVE